MFVVAVVIIAVAAGSAWWFRGGGTLQAGAFRAGTATQRDEWAHVFVPLWSTGGTVSLLSADALDTTGKAEIQFSAVYPGPSQIGKLSTLTGGTLEALGFHPAKVDGAHVRAREPAGPPMYLVLSMRASTAGLLGVQGVDVAYRSGRHTRRLKASVSVCDSVAAVAITDDTSCAPGSG